MDSAPNDVGQGTAMRLGRGTAMRLGRLRLACCSLLIGSAMTCLPARAAEIAVLVSDIHPGTGSIRVALYKDSDSFRHEARALQVLSTPASAASVVVRFKDVPLGTYALLAYHDANDNQKLDLLLGMFPQEGWGLSNDPNVIGPPRFTASAFPVADQVTRIGVRLHY